MGDPLSSVRGDVRIWASQAPAAAIEVFRSVPLMNELKRFRNSCFQLQGQHDGAMSEDCKLSFRRSFEAIDEFIKAVG